MGDVCASKRRGAGQRGGKGGGVFFAGNIPQHRAPACMHGNLCKGR